jgi:predicted DsbA family dithiol-disulfide isomerase
MAPTLGVDIWSDVVCPFFYLGFQQFHEALESFEHREEVTIRHHAFELDPRASAPYSGTLNELLATKYSLPLERAAELNQRVEHSATELGLTWALDRARPTNTFDAHRVIALAAEQGRQEPMLERLFRAYFSDGLLVSDPETLTHLATEVGVEGADEVVRGHDFEESVRRDEALAAERGITGVPALIFDERIHVSGARGTDVMLLALRDAWVKLAN